MSNTNDAVASPSSSPVDVVASPNSSPSPSPVDAVAIPSSSPVDVVPSPNTNDVDVVAIVSHQNRIERILQNFSNFSTIQNRKIRLMNGAILKIEVRGGNGTIELIHDGDNNSVKPDLYFSVSESGSVKNAAGTEFEKVKFVPLDFYLPNNEYKKDIVMYIIRHGEGYHNLKTWSAKFNWDAELTPKGIDQAKETGTALCTYLSENGQALKYMFASYLRRSQQTMAYMYSTMNTQNSACLDAQLRNSPVITILECINEIGKGVENIRGATRYDKIVIPPALSIPVSWNYYDAVRPSTSTVDETTEKTSICRNPYSIVFDAIEFIKEQPIKQKQEAIKRQQEQRNLGRGLAVLQRRQGGKSHSTRRRPHNNSAASRQHRRGVHGTRKHHARKTRRAHIKTKP